MTNKKLKILLSATVLLLSGLLLHIQPGHSEPVALDDRTMDTVMAGSVAEGGGVVVGQSSEAIANRTAGLDLDGEAQMGAKGLNIVNSTESAVANTVNIWDGSGVVATKEDSDANSEVKINQINNITQDQVRSATITGYLRSEADHAESSKNARSIGYSSDFVDYHSVTNLSDETRTLITTSNGEVNTLLKFSLGDNIDFSGHLGQGIAAAGHTEIDFEGGSTDIAAVLSGDVTAAGNGSLVADGGLVLVTRVVLPSIKIVIDGVGCGVAMGSCKANSTSFEQIDAKTDNSTLDIFEDHQSGQIIFSEVQSRVYRSPFEIESARAEYIVIDDSTLELNSDVTLELSASAQKDIKGMNIVNSIGSNVANSTNVSRAIRFEGRKATLVLNQFNTVNHGH